MLNYPLTQYMFCAPDEGAAAVIMCRGDIAHRYTDKPVFLRATEIRTRRYGAYEVHATSAPSTRTLADGVRRAGRLRGGRDRARGCRRHPAAGHRRRRRGHPHGRERFCADGEQEKLLADGATEIGGSLPVNTDGGLIANGEPIGASGLRQVHELVRQLRGQAGDRQVPGEPAVGFAQVYGAPGTASATILSR